jgi:peptide/nickel transport system permease protein
MAPGIAIVLAALGFTLLGEQMREALDPKYHR